jgi:hypothetical protein
MYETFTFIAVNAAAWALLAWTAIRHDTHIAPDVSIHTEPSELPHD